MFDELFLLLIQFPERSGDKSSAFSYMMILKCRLLSILLGQSPWSMAMCLVWQSVLFSNG